MIINISNYKYTELGEVNITQPNIENTMHLTIRMAWHDNNWNGKVCSNPEGNSYCTGAHSLLSGRIEKKKKTIKL